MGQKIETYPETQDIARSRQNKPIDMHKPFISFLVFFGRLGGVRVGVKEFCEP